MNGGGSSGEWRRIERRIEGEEPIKEYLLLEAATVERRTWESGGSTGAAERLIHRRRCQGSGETPQR
jgi:hypothetical protein